MEEGFRAGGGRLKEEWLENARGCRVALPAWAALALGPLPADLTAHLGL